MEQKNRSTGTALLLWYVLVSMLGLGGLAGLALSLAPYSGLKPFFDRLARDSSFERFTPQLYQAYHLPLLIAGSLLLLVCGLAIWKARYSQSVAAAGLHFLKSLLTRLFSDFPRLLSNAVRATPPTWELAILLVIVLFGLAARLIFIERAMEYDEAYTYMEFARHSFQQAISDYHHPNNHVFHTLLVQLSTRLFGGAPWAVRLPAFTAGLLILPAAYWLGRRLYRPWIGLTAAGLLAAAPVMISYSVNARGYTLITLFFFVLFILADSVRNEKNLAAWALMIIITGLGFYTVPIFLYPFGMVFTWLCLSGIWKDVDTRRYGGWKGWLRYLVGYGFCSALLSMFFYMPIFRVKGLLTVFNNDPIIRSLSLADFLSSLSFRLGDIQKDWLAGVLPAWLIPILLVGVALSILLHKRVARSRVNILLAALLFVVPVLLVQRPQLLARVWMFIFSLLVLASVAGGVALMGWIPWKRQDRFLQNAAAALVLATALLSGGRYLVSAWQHPASISFETADSAALVTQYIKENLVDGDVVVVTPLYDARFWYYFDYYQIPQRHIRDVKRHHFTRVLVIVDGADLSLEETILTYGPDQGFLQMDTLQEAYRAGNFILYQITPHQDLVDRTFGVESESK